MAFGLGVTFISQAYSVLSDKQKRQQYDEGADIAEINQGGGGGGHGHGHGGFSHADFSQFFGGGGGFGGFRQLTTATIHATTVTHISIVQIKINKPDRTQVSYEWKQG